MVTSPFCRSANHPSCSHPSPAFILGKTEAEVEAELKGVPDADRIRPHKVFEGNRVRLITLMNTWHACLTGTITAADQLHHGGEVDPVHPGTAHRHVRAQDLHAGSHLGHQLVRPVGVSTVPSKLTFFAGAANVMYSAIRRHCIHRRKRNI